MTLKRSAAITGFSEIKPTPSPEGKTTLGIWTDVSRQAVLDASLSMSHPHSIAKRPKRVDRPAKELRPRESPELPRNR